MATPRQRLGPLAAGDAPGTSVVACLTDLADLERCGADAFDGVACLEVRADLVGDVATQQLRSHFDGPLLYTLRSRAEGGRFVGGQEDRHRRLLQAGSAYELVDLEGERDLEPALLDRIPAERRIVSWHGEVADVPELAERFERFSTAAAARLYKLVTGSGSLAAAMVPLGLLQELGRSDVLAFAQGEAGTFTRLLAPCLGADVVYASFGAIPAAGGQLSIERLATDYGIPSAQDIDRVFGIVGHPVAHSLSPRLHNGGYRSSGLAARYVPFDADHFSDFWLDVVETELFESVLPLAGLSVTTPYKRAALAVAGASSPLAQRIESANTMVHSGLVWEADTTDGEGVLGALRVRGVAIPGQRAAVVGCGAAGRAAAASLQGAGAELVVVNRSEEPGLRLAERLRVPFVSLEDFDPSRFGILVNATSLGSRPEDPPAFALRGLGEEAIVVDLVYAAGKTRLIDEALDRGLAAVEGREVLLWQALPQYRLMTGEELSPTLAAELLGLELPEDAS